jgi:thiamine-phosphate pyrophosphorylase
MASTAQSRLYLKLPATRMLETALADAIARAGASVACVLLCSNAAAGDSVRVNRTCAEQYLRLAREQDLALLLDEDVELAEEIGADGVHITAGEAAYADARARLGSGRIVGVGCGQSRHDAMVMAERGADYVAFAPAGDGERDKEELTELIAWWAEIFVVPCVAFGVATPVEASRLAALGADFIAPSEGLWQAHDPAERLAEFAAALDRARNAA